MVLQSLFDSHCHVQDSRFDGDREAVLGRAEATGVTHLVCCGTQEGDWGAVLDLAARYPQVLPMVGLHPWFVLEAKPGWARRLRELAECSRVGIGECGLDFTTDPGDRAAQEAALRIQLRLARALDRPLALHCRKAWARLLALLQEEGLPASGGLVHAFSGSAEMATQLQALGLHLSFGGSITWSGGTKPAKVLAVVNPHRLLVESDAPDLLPQGVFQAPTRLNEPANLPLIVEAAARWRGEAFSAVARQTRANGMILFGGLMP